MKIGVYEKKTQNYFVVCGEDVERVFGFKLSTVKRVFDGKAALPDFILTLCPPSAMLQYPEGKA